MKYFLAIDIGASSGRHIVGWMENNEIKTNEVYRFHNEMKKQDKYLVWDIDELFENVKIGIKFAIEKYKKLESLAIDTWGVDYVLLTNKEVLTPCFAYRDNRTEKIINEVHKIMPFNKLYEKTGIQYQPFNTIYQLFIDKLQGRLNNATDFLMMPEYLNYMLTGVKMHEYTNATTTGLVNVNLKEYDKEIITSLGLPIKLFTNLHQPGTKVGNLKPEIAQLVGGQVDVVLCASHDTASAVEGINMEKNNPYISSGTWSLLGMKVSQAITDENSLNTNYSNEGGVGYFRYQKNIMGMWIINRLREELCPNKPFPQIVKEARKSTFNDYVDVNNKMFLAPKSMKEAFDNWFIKRESNYGTNTHQGTPRNESDYFRCAFISLATNYKEALSELKNNCKKEFETLYIVGGGAKNSLINELTTEICKIKVKTLPIEATAIGNLKIQIRRR